MGYSSTFWNFYRTLWLKHCCPSGLIRFRKPVLRKIRKPILGVCEQMVAIEKGLTDLNGRFYGRKCRSCGSVSEKVPWMQSTLKQALLRLEHDYGYDEV